ncbi:MAG: alpha/beta hydrolase [Acidimicrobiales bacterium]|nr:alpha/beta hydrolase [Acidimicrobiales bacterium]
MIDTAASGLPLVVLVHGAWHGAWCWATLQDRLDRRGIASLAIDLPGHGASTSPATDLHGHAAHVADVVTRWGRPTVLVGHSYGGAVVTEAAAHTDGVAHLVYLAAFAPAAGDSVMSQLGSMERREVALGAAMRMRDDGTSVLDAELATPALYGRCDPASVRSALARLSPHAMATFTQPVTGDPLATIESTYVVCTEDGAVHPDHQRTMSERCTHVVTLDTDHSPFMSMPAETADVIERIVRTLAVAPCGTEATEAGA